MKQQDKQLGQTKSESTGRKVKVNVPYSTRERRWDAHLPV